MRVRGATVQKFALGAALLAGLAWNLSHAGEVRGVELATGATGTRAEIMLDRATEYTVLRLKSPERLAIDLPASTLSSRLKLPAGEGVVQQVRTGQPSPGTVRVVFDLGQSVAPLKPRLEQSPDGARVVVEWPGDGPAVATAAPSRPPASLQPILSNASPTVASPVTPAPEADPARASADATSRLISELARRGAAGTASADPPARPVTPAATPSSSIASSPAPSSTPPSSAGASVAGSAAPVPTAPTASIVQPPAPVVTPSAPLPSGKGLRPLVIAIDPGHGGQDPGAIGPNGNREKDITLAIARELARQINATPGLKAVLTRDSDMFLPLPRRAQLARQARADMFVSIHADAAENRNARGSSVYVLSLKGASSQRARWLADKENAADLIGGASAAHGGGTLASVLLDLTQSGHMKASEDAASHVLAGLKRVGHNHKPSVERANFAVLRTSDMPSMLVETAFISNPEEERRLTDPAHQRTLAAAVLDGINTYFQRQPPPGTMYAARAQSAAGAAGGSP